MTNYGRRMPAARQGWVWSVALLLILAWTAPAQAGSTCTLPDFTVLVKQVGPAVVNISTKQRAEPDPGQTQQGGEMPNLPPNSPWRDLFKHFFGQGQHGDQGDQGGSNGAPRDYETSSLGSGFIIDRNGYILTNNHVVAGADEILVRLSDRRELPAKVVGADKRSDIALLKIDAHNLPVVKIGDSAKLKVGEWVMAIGSPFGFDHSVSAGVVSALGRALPDESYIPFIQTDVAINPGNSGGPLFNLDGQVVGINSQIYSRTGGFMGLSFAIPINVAMNVVEQLKSKGHVTRGWLGVMVQDVTRKLAESFGMSKPTGALVAKVLPHSPAAKAGIEVGDVIVKFNGKPVDYSSDLPPIVGQTRIGRQVPVEVIRDGKVRTLMVAVGELPKEAQLKSELDGGPARVSNDRLGMTVRPLSADQREQLGIKGGVLVEEVEAGAAQDAGVRQGDVLLKLDGRDLNSVADYGAVLKHLPSGKSVPLLVQRANGPVFLALKVPAK